VTAVTGPRPAATPRHPVLRLLGAIGSPIIDGAAWVVRLVAMGSGIALLALRPSTWRRTVRAEFSAALRSTLIGSLPATVVMAVLVGVGLLYQVLFWLSLAGEVSMIGRFITAVLIREVGPVLVALVVIGRSGTVTLIQLMQMREGGQLRMLDSQGIDPFLLLVLPRTLAFTLANFTLTVLFIPMTLLAGYMVAGTLGIARQSFWGFLDTLLHSMGSGDFVLVPAKSLLIGFTIGVVCCYTALTSSHHAARVVATGFVRATLSTLAISGMLTFVVI